jgi:hypothetical protein
VTVIRRVLIRIGEVLARLRRDDRTEAEIRAALFAGEPERFRRRFEGDPDRHRLSRAGRSRR